VEGFLKLVLPFILCFTILTASPGPARPQIQPQNHPPDNVTLPPGPLVGFDAMAHVLAMELVKSGHKKVVVLDFTGPDKDWSPFSDWLAEQFSLALSRVGYPIIVVDRAEIPSDEVLYDFSSEDEFGSETEMHHMANSVCADSFISGTYRPAENGIGVTLEARRTLKLGNGNSMYSSPMSSVIGKIPLPEGTRPEPQLPFDAVLADSKLARPGEGGVSYPSCIHCPLPDYSTEADAKKIQGTVILRATITAEGRAIRIKVEMGLGYGLDKQAVDVVQDWEFRPATDVDGKPVPVRLPIEVIFRLY
jgi:TonB family protein